MTEVNLMADGFVVGRNIDNPDLMRVRFTGGNDAFNVIMPIALGQSLAQEVDNASVQSRPRPIGPDELRLGTVFQTISRQVHSKADGGKRLTLTVGMDDGARTLPLDLSPDEVADLISDLSKL